MAPFQYECCPQFYAKMEEGGAESAELSQKVKGMLHEYTAVNRKPEELAR